MAATALTACTPAGDSLALDVRLARLDLRQRAAQVTAVAVELPTLREARALDTRLRSLGAAAPGTIWIRRGAPDAVALLAARASAFPVPVLLAAHVGEGLGAVVTGATRLPPITRLVAQAPSTRVAAVLSDDATAVGLGLGFVEVTLPAWNEPRPLPEIERIAADIERVIRETADRGFPVGLALSRPHDAPAGSCNTSQRDLLIRPFLRAAAAGGAPALLVDASTFRWLSCDHEDPGRAAMVTALRRDTGWDGLVVLDLRDVGAESRSDAAVRALVAGVDLLLVGEDTSLPDTLAGAVGDGRLPASRLEEATRRVLAFKLRRDDRGGGIAPARAARRLAEVERSRIGRWTTAASPAPAPVFGPVLVRGAPEDAGMSVDGLRRVDGILRDGLVDSVYTAAAVAVGRRGVLVHMAGYGVLPGGMEVDPNATLFDLASLSKVVGTATAAGILLDRGRLSLDAPVARWLPEYADEGREAVTLRHLLSHTSGLPSGLWLYGSAESPEEAIAQVLRQPLRRSPGEAVEYSDLGMMLVAEIVERVSGMSLDDFLARNVFLPLGMSSTTYLPPAVVHGRVVPTAGENERPYDLHGVVHDANAFRLAGVAGHAGIFSTARDLAVFAQMMLNGGVYGPVEILADSTVHEFTRRQADDRALGWDTPAEVSSAGRFFSADAYGHTGYTGTSLWIDPARDAFVVLLTNRTYARASAREILDLRIEVHEAVSRAMVDVELERR